MLNFCGRYNMRKCLRYLIMSIMATIRRNKQRYEAVLEIPGTQSARAVGLAGAVESCSNVQFMFQCFYVRYLPNLNYLQSTHYSLMGN